MYSTTPGVVTDDGVACLAVTANVIGGRTLDELKEALGAEPQRVSNVCNCTAYSLDSSCEDVLALIKFHELLFGFLGGNPTEIDRLLPFYIFMEKLKSGKDRVDHILYKSDIAPVAMEYFGSSGLASRQTRNVAAIGGCRHGFF